MIVTNNERALELIEDSNYYMRSCWECNSSHTHLKDRKELFLCFACGKWWMNGDYLTDNEQHCNSEFKTSN